MTTHEYFVLIGSALLAAILTVCGLQKWSRSPFQLSFFAVAAAAVAAFLSFASTFTISWSAQSSDLLIILAALLSGVAPAALILGTAFIANLARPR
ncbi:MAG: hypothetical protein ACTHJK_01615 [Sphingomicrobium sp.]